MEIVEHVDNVICFKRKFEIFKKGWNDVYCYIEQNSKIICLRFLGRVYSKMVTNWNSRLEYVYKSEELERLCNKNFYL